MRLSFASKGPAKVARTTESSRTRPPMKTPLIASIEEMLATKEGQFGTLSIVARRGTPDFSPTRAALTAVGLAPGGGADQAAIVYAFEGEVRAIFTSPEHPYDLGQDDRVPGDGELVVRTRKLEESHVDEFHSAMEVVEAHQALGLPLWTPIRTSAAFAAQLWNRTFGEDLRHRAFGLSNADNLAKSIRSFESLELGIEQSADEPLDLRISERILELSQREDAQNQSQVRSLGL